MVHAIVIEEDYWPTRRFEDAGVLPEYHAGVIDFQSFAAVEFNHEGLERLDQDQGFNGFLETLCGHDYFLSCLGMVIPFRY
jgi:hypothetical protein